MAKFISKKNQLFLFPLQIIDNQLIISYCKTILEKPLKNIWWYQIKVYIYTMNDNTHTKNSNMKIQITRLDYQNGNGYKALTMLPDVYSINDLTDYNEVNYVFLWVDSIEDAHSLATKFPKYCGGVAQTVNVHLDGSKKFRVMFQFNTFWTNKTTGAINESAVKARNKTLEIIKSL